MNLKIKNIFHINIFPCNFMSGSANKIFPNWQLVACIRLDINFYSVPNSFSLVTDFIGMWQGILKSILRSLQRSSHYSNLRLCPVPKTQLTKGYILTFQMLLTLISNSHQIQWHNPSVGGRGLDQCQARAAIIDSK